MCAETEQWDLAVENEPLGAAVNAAKSFGANYSAFVSISSFSES